jgi:mono/diheme cytochrome c family protein
VAVTPELLAKGRGVYDRTCALCHGATGEGMPNGAPTLAGLKDFAKVRQKVATGGVQMPPMSAMLPDSDIDAVAHFITAGMPKP